MIEAGSDLLEFLQGCQDEAIILEHANCIVGLHIDFLTGEGRIDGRSTRVDRCGDKSLLGNPVINCILVIVLASVQLVMHLEVCRLLDNPSGGLGFVCEGGNYVVLRVYAKLHSVYFTLIPVRSVARP